MYCNDCCLSISSVSYVTGCIGLKIKKKMKMKIMKWINKKDPWVTPNCITWRSEVDPLTLTNWVRLLKYDRNHSNAVPLIRNRRERLESKIQWSRENTPLHPLLFQDISTAVCPVWRFLQSNSLYLRSSNSCTQFNHRPLMAFFDYEASCLQTYLYGRSLAFRVFNMTWL